MSAIMALASVVFPDPVPPMTRMFRWSFTASHRTSFWRSVMVPVSTYSSSVKTREAGFRIVKAGAETTGGTAPENRKPPGYSPSSCGCSYESVLPSREAKVRNVTSASPERMVPIHFIGSPNRSCQTRPSGFSMTSQVIGSSRAELTSCPMCMRSEFSQLECKVDVWCVSIFISHPSFSGVFLFVIVGFFGVRRRRLGNCVASRQDSWVTKFQTSNRGQGKPDGRDLAFVLCLTGS